MFQPQSIPFSTSFYGATSTSTSSQANYGGLPLSYSPDGDDVVVPDYGFAPSPSGPGRGLASEVVAAPAPGGSPNTGGNGRSHGGPGRTRGHFNNLGPGRLALDSGVAPAGGTMSDASGKRSLDQTDFEGAGIASLSSKGHGRATAAQLRQEQQEQQHLLYVAPSPVALPHRLPHRVQQQRQQQEQLEAQHHLLLGQAAPAITHAHVNAHAHTSAHSHSGRPHHPATPSPNHQPSPPSHSRPHLNLNPPLSHFVQPGSSSCNQPASINFAHHQHKNNSAAAAAHPNFSIPSPAGSVSSSSNLNILQGTCDPSSGQPYASSGHSNPINIATPAASTPSNRAHTVDMAGESASESAFQDELVAQQRAAETYQPQLEGPVIGEKVSSDVITEEYAKADPFYVEKTVNLPQTYSHFRPVQGDGNCGWRAIGFSYFEHLILSGDPEKLQLEVARLTSLNNYLTTYGGYDLDLFEDMVFETLNLLKDLSECVANTNTAMALLMQRFNNRECSNAIIYHLRLLAGSWLKGNFAQYEPFLDTGGDAASWAHLNIESPDREIDHLSIMLLSSILLKPIGFVLEIAYLDRTPGSEVNTYRFPDETNGQDPMSLGPIIYLLFRPDHYDILYKSPRESIMPAPEPVALDLQVNRAVSFSHHHQITSHPPSLHNFATLDYSPLTMLPGFGGPPPGLSSMTTSSPTSPMQDAYTPSAPSSWLQTPFSEPPMQQNIPPPPPPLATGPTQAPASSQSQLPSGAPAKANQPVDYQLRFSPQCFHLKNPAADSSLLPQGSFQEPSFTTTMFKNSHFNKAHYNNPHFHPEEWTPEDDPHERSTGGVTKKKTKTKLEH